MSAAAPAGSLVKGTSVIVNGLVARADLNGCTGTVLSYDNGRYATRVSGDPVRIKAENLTMKAYVPKPTMTDDVVSTIQGANVSQLAWLICEYGPTSEQIAELVLLFACALFSPEMVGYPAPWSRDGQQNVAAFLKSGGHLGVVRSMDAHPRNATVQQRGVQQLMTLVVEEVSQTLQSTDAVNAAGGAAAAVRAMRQHPTNEELQTFGCRLLMNLSTDEARGQETGMLSAAKRAVVAAGAIPALADALTAFPLSLELLLPALNGLTQLPLNYEEAVHVALAAELPRRVVRVLDNVLGNALDEAKEAQKAEVLAKGCMCLGNLIYGGAAGGGAGDAGGGGAAGGTYAASAEAVVGAGAIPTICKVMRAQSHAPSIVQNGCGALHNLAALGYAQACREAGAVALAEAARRDWPSPIMELLWAALQVPTTAGGAAGPV
jgi:hypothetical protein